MCNVIRRIPRGVLGAMRTAAGAGCFSRYLCTTLQPMERPMSTGSAPPHRRRRSREHLSPEGYGVATGNSGGRVVPDSEDPMTAMLRYVDVFNKGDSAAMTATCADPMQILDGMSPHVWQGPTAAEDWWRDARAEGERVGVSDYNIVLGRPRHD